MNREQLTIWASSFEGAEAIYFERQGFSHVKIGDIRITDWGMTATVTLIRTPGFLNSRPANWGISAAWEIFHCSEDRMSIAYVGMRACFDRQLIETAIRLCATLPEKYGREHTQAIMNCLAQFWRDKGKHLKARNTTRAADPTNRDSET